MSTSQIIDAFLPPLDGDTWDLTPGTLSRKRYRPACSHSDTHGLVVSGGFYDFLASVESTNDGATFDTGTISDMPSDASKYFNCLVALDNGNLFTTGIASLQPGLDLNLI